MVVERWAALWVVVAVVVVAVAVVGWARLVWRRAGRGLMSSFGRTRMVVVLARREPRALGWVALLQHRRTARHRASIPRVAA